MNRMSIKNFANMNERKLSGIISRAASGFIDIADPDSVLAHHLFFNRSSCKMRNIKTNALFFDYSLEVIFAILKEHGSIRASFFSGKDAVCQYKDYTWTSFLFDIIDIAKTNPSYIRDHIGEILSHAVWFRRNEVEDSCFSAFDGSPIPAIIRDKIVEHLNFVQRVCDTGGFSLHDLKKIKVTFLAPCYTWKNWDEFLSPSPTIGKRND